MPPLISSTAATRPAHAGRSQSRLGMACCSQWSGHNSPTAITIMTAGSVPMARLASAALSAIMAGSSIIPSHSSSNSHFGRRQRHKLTISPR